MTNPKIKCIEYMGTANLPPTVHGAPSVHPDQIDEWKWCRLVLCNGMVFVLRYADARTFDKPTALSPARDWSGIIVDSNAFYHVRWLTSLEECIQEIIEDAYSDPLP